MTKKQLIITSLCASVMTLTMNAQGLYLGVGGGYGFSGAKQTINDDSKSTTSASGTSTEYTSHPVSLGKGINAGLYAGYMFGKNVGAEIGFSYLMGSKNTFTDENTNSVLSSSDKNVDEWKAKMIRIVPTIRIMGGEEKIHPYMKTGLIVGIGTKLTNTYTSESSDPSGSHSSEEIWDYTGGIALGFHGALGINYMISDKLGIFAEVAGNYQTWSPKKGTMTKSVYDGQDQMPYLDTRDKELEFVDSYTQDSSVPPDVNRPDKSTKFYLPFSSFGINVGLHLSFPKGE
jgi:hypothetical protein